MAGKHQHAAEAVAVAHSITSLNGQAHALAEVAEALAIAGQRDRAAATAADAEAVARSITDPDHQAHALASVAGALAMAGQRDHAAAADAEAVARSITGADFQARAMAKVASSPRQRGTLRGAQLTDCVRPVLRLASSATMTLAHALQWTQQ